MLKKKQHIICIKTNFMFYILAFYSLNCYSQIAAASLIKKKCKQWRGEGASEPFAPLETEAGGCSVICPKSSQFSKYKTTSRLHCLFLNNSRQDLKLGETQNAQCYSWITHFMSFSSIFFRCCPEEPLSCKDLNRLNLKISQVCKDWLKSWVHEILL